MSKKRFVYYQLPAGNPFGEHGVLDQKTNKPIATLHSKEGAEKVLEAVNLVNEIITKENAPLISAMTGLAAAVKDLIVVPSAPIAPTYDGAVPPPVSE